jgi:ABC-type uncharacterized transport system permease subunit
MVYFVQTTLQFALPLMIVALAGVFSERSGIINIALEGMMIFGAFIGVLTVRLLLKTGLTDKQGQLILLLAILAAALGGALFALLLAFASINLKADQTIGGTAINLLAPAFVLFLIIIISQQTSLDINSKFSPAKLFMLRPADFGFKDASSLNDIEQIFFNKVYPTTYYAIILYVVLSIILYTTKFGLRLRSCGEHPQASASLGINVFKMRYAGTLISGALAGFGGFIYALTSAGCSSTGDVAGLGFLALAVMIFGNWKPLNIVGAALLFGTLQCIAVGYPYIDFNKDGVFALKELGISSNFYRVLPYVITLVVLAFTSKKSRAPKAEGQPYDKGKR